MVPFEETKGDKNYLEVLEVHVRLALITGNVLVIIFAICGNVVACLVASKSRLTPTPTRIIIISLGLSDLFLTVSSAPLDVAEIMDCLHAWIAGPLSCKIVPFAHFLFLMANSCSLFAIVIHRYWTTSLLLTITSTGQTPSNSNSAENPSKWVAFVVLLLIWLLAAGFSVPYIQAYELVHYNCEFAPFSQISEAGSGQEDGGEEEEDSVVRVHSTNTLTGASCAKISKFFPDRSVNFSSVCNPKPGINIVSICEQTKEAKGQVYPYHLAQGVIFILLIFSVYLGFHFIRKSRRLEKEFERRLPISRGHGTENNNNNNNKLALELNNIIILEKIRTVLHGSRRGLRFIICFSSVFIICRIPIWLFVVVISEKPYPRSNETLSVYYFLHLLANLKGAISPFFYARSSKALRSSHHYSHSSSSGQNAKVYHASTHDCFCCCNFPWRRRKIVEFNETC